MSCHNTYSQYKRDTNHLLYWIINTSNAILVSPQRPNSSHCNSQSEASNGSTKRNTTGQTTVNGLLEMSHRIAAHLTAVPPTIFRLFQHVIEARSRASGLFSQIAESDDDPELQSSNEKHQHFIKVLKEAFEVLGGKRWADEMKRAGRSKAEEKEEDFEKVIFSNKFASLNLGTAATSESSDEEDLTNTTSSATDLKRNRQSQKKAQRKKKKTKPKHKTTETKAQTLDEVPIESYRIIEEAEAGNVTLMTDYLFACHDLFQQMAKHRTHSQLLWEEVAYEGLNSAVAAGVVDTAVSMVKDTVSEIFLEFPGHESYETCMKTVTRGDPSKLVGTFNLVMLAHAGDIRQAKQCKESAIDPYEHLQVHTFHALRDFLVDFRKNRTGKPTKRMAAEIGDWDPEMKLRDVFKNDRIQWRRKLTINWLYDFVNQWSSAALKNSQKSGKKIDFAKTDWTSGAPWQGHRRMFGHKMIAFAEHITSLAWQAATADVVAQVLPQHVFQLTCIIDSWAATRGWINHPLQGHVLRKEPAAKFVSTRDIDLFLGDPSDLVGFGWNLGVIALKRELQRSEMMNRQVGAYQALAILLDGVTQDFNNFLGHAKDVHGVGPLPPSRFASVAPDGAGLSKYCPYFCGDGLLEALAISFHCGMKAWDETPEPVLCAHLHNMLLESGTPRYAHTINGLWGMCEGMFPEEIFGSRDVPKGNYRAAMLDFLKSISTKFAFRSTRRIKALAANLKNAKTINELLDSTHMKVFRTKTFTSALIKANFDIDKVPDSEIRWEYTMGLLRLDEVKVVTDPITKVTTLENTEMVLRARERGMRDADFLWNKFKHGPCLGRDDPVEACKNMPAEFGTNWTHLSFAQLNKRSQYDEPTILDAVKSDLHREICGKMAPYLGINYLLGCAWAMHHFQSLESKLLEVGHLGCAMIYSGYPGTTHFDHRRVAVAAMALKGNDEQLCRIAGEVFEDLCGSIESTMYWSRQDETKTKELADYSPEKLCCVM